MSRASSAARRGAGSKAVPPAPQLRSRALYHGLRILLLLLTAVAVYLLFPAPHVPDTAVLERGVVAPNDVIAEFAFDIPKGETELRQERNDAASAVPPVYDFSAAVADSVVAGIGALFQEVDSVVRATPPPQRTAALSALFAQNRIDLTPGAQELLRDGARREQLRRRMTAALEANYARGVLAAAPMGRDAGTAVRIRWTAEREGLVPLDSVMTPERLFAQVARQTGALGADAGELERLILIRYFRPNLIRNPLETEAARARARGAVDPVQARVLRGERVVGAHEQIGAPEEARLQAYQTALRERGLQPGATQSGARALGAVLYNALILLIFGLLLYLTRPAVYGDLRMVSVFALLVAVVAGAGALISRFALPAELIPVPFAALIVAVLWERRLALAFALVLALLLGGQTPFVGLTTPLTAAVGGAAAAFSVSVISRRSRIWFFISIVALAFAAAAITMGLLRARTPLEIGASMLWGTINAIVASILAIGFLPLLESFTRVTTDQTLLELSDPTRKLLRRLSLEAPGTYDHTLRVANLAEAASHAIGANGLLARVGTYYHDIGKLVKPQFFIENQPKGRNPHDKLRPVMSSAIIRGHITEGLRLAEEERLPPVIRRFIAEHHGTQPISFFYDRAREADPNATLNPAEYAYPGPKPQTKETAILMLADSAESATRALSDPNPARIHDTVERIVAGKIAAGQLDECPLTLREVGIIKAQLNKVLEGMYHHRIDYPPSPPPPGVPPAEGSGVLTGAAPPDS